MTKKKKYNAQTDAGDRQQARAGARLQRAAQGDELGQGDGGVSSVGSEKFSEQPKRDLDENGGLEDWIAEINDNLQRAIRQHDVAAVAKFTNELRVAREALEVMTVTATALPHKGGVPEQRSEPTVGSGRLARTQTLFRPRNLPSFQAGGDQLLFIEDLECVLNAQGYEDLEQYGWRGLLMTLGEYPHKRSLVQAHVKKGESWRKIRAHFIRTNQPPELQATAERQLNSLQQGDNDLQEYYDEFVELARRVHRNADPNRTWCMADLDQHTTKFVLGLRPDLQTRYDQFRAYELAQGSEKCLPLPQIFELLSSLEASRLRVRALGPEHDDDGDTISGSISNSKRKKGAQRRAGTAKNRSPLTDPDVYDVEQIIDHEHRDGETFFRVRWEGFGPSDDTWVRKEDFQSAGLIRTYFESVSARERNNHKTVRA
jgi:hypothetical protein